MGYLQEVDRWLDMLCNDLADGKVSYAEMKGDIRERILQSYKNGLAARDQSPAPRTGQPRRYEGRRQRA